MRVKAVLVRVGLGKDVREVVVAQIVVSQMTAPWVHVLEEAVDGCEWL